MMPFVILLLCLLCSVGYSGQAQSIDTKTGFIITYADDTVSGSFRKLKDTSQQVRFMADSSSSFVSYTTSDIKAFGYTKDHYFKAVAVPEEERLTTVKFLLCLVEGDLALYQDGNSFYVEKPKGTLYELKAKIIQKDNGLVRVNKRYIGMLNYLTADCPNLQSKIENVDLRALDLIDVVASYNYCVGSSEATKVSKSARAKILLGGKLGASVGKTTHLIKEAFRTDLDSEIKTGFSGGVLLDFSYRGRFSLRPELLIAQRKGEGQRSIGNYYKDSVWYSATVLQMPLSLYYTVPSERFRPFALIGGAFSHTIRDRSHTGRNNQTTGLNTERNQFSYRLGGGLSYVLSNKSTVGIEYAYERILLNGTKRAVQVFSRVHNITITYFLPERRK